MRIAFVSDAIYPYNKGGKEKRLYEISTRLSNMGHDVHIYTMHWWKSPQRERTEDGVHLHAISPYYPMYRGDKRSVKEGVLFGLACFRLLRAKFDVVDVDHMPFFPVFSVWLVCLLRRKRMYGTWHEALTAQDWLHYMGKAGYIASLIERASIRLPHTITAASAHTRQLLATYHKRHKRVGLVPSGIDGALIRGARPTREVCDILYAGRLVKDKNVSLLIQAFALVAKQDPMATCVIIGHGIERKNLEQLIVGYGLQKQVRLLEPLAEAKDVYAYMKRAKVFVLPSVREGFGIVALEALACGTPVVTVNSPANAAKDLITEGVTGSVVPLQAQAVADAMQMWLARNTALQSKSTVADHDWGVLAKKQAEVYAQ